MSYNKRVVFLVFPLVYTSCISKPRSGMVICLERLIKTSSHEIGHMFSMLHCTHAVCVMNGSNSLRESDALPNRLCSECLSKLHWNIKFDLRKRLHALDNFLLAHGLHKDRQFTKKDLDLTE